MARVIEVPAKIPLMRIFGHTFFDDYVGPDRELWINKAEQAQLKRALDLVVSIRDRLPDFEESDGQEQYDMAQSLVEAEMGLSNLVEDAGELVPWCNQRGRVGSWYAVKEAR